MVGWHSGKGEHTMSHREHAHQLIDRMQETQLSGLVQFLETIINPVAYSLANAPLDDEPFIEEDREAVAEALEWRRHNELIPHEQVLAEFGLTMADWEKMASEEPLPEPATRRNG